MTLAETFDQLDWATIASYVELKQEGISTWISKLSGTPS
jgi:hypothetical protein